MTDLYCAIDLGGTKINIGIMTKNGEVLDDIKILTEVEKGPENAIKNIKNAIYELLKKLNLKKEDLKGIGIGSPGPLDSERGVIIESANLKGWKNVEIVKNLSGDFKNIPIKLENDGNAAALGEYLFGFGKGSRNFIYITVSTGVGGGAVIDGKLQKGGNSNAFEVGHTIISINGPKCNCGNNGCLEAFASGTAIERIAEEKLLEGRESLISQIKGKGKLKAEHVFEAAKKGDKLALEIVENEGYYLGIGLFNIMALYNPEKISIGGGVSNALEMFYDKMIETINNMSLKASTQICKIEKAQRKDCGLVGAGALAFYEKR
ncbi:ROK family protein [Tepidibacter formicigenes]|jgi:glucokinase|uniref:Glucokinase n=1 Tax=Tepidibacter formicigenes DSM 15518 TaxID=1123349 RepID=A0A1M6NF44_9FIRM|nr:ROK family protein [Tepidibacter formicigenes]SHJ94307.1 glucokinase [Tepidibacter formicigenes DSM 15518]